MTQSDITFDELRRVLLDLGFTESKRGKFWFFKHSSSETTFSYRPYQFSDRVTAVDLHMTRRHLDLRGVLDECGFDNRLRKTPA